MLVLDDPELLIQFFNERRFGFGLTKRFRCTVFDFCSRFFETPKGLSPCCDVDTETEQLHITVWKDKGPFRRLVPPFFTGIPTDTFFHGAFVE